MPDLAGIVTDQTGDKNPGAISRLAIAAVYARSERL
jgi:hypothetical protein